MALTINTQDLDNYPGTVKKITVDNDKFVPLNTDGDDRFVIVVSTSAYSNNVAKTVIPTLYITDFKSGWIKSSGFTGSGGKFNITTTNKYLKIKIDETTGGDGNGFYTIELTPNSDNTPVDGEALANDIEIKLRNVVLDTEDIGFYLAYKNADVIYRNGKIWIVSGTFSSRFTGINRSSVEISSPTVSGCADILGFNLYTSSMFLNNIAVKEAVLTQNYTTGSDTLHIGAGTGVGSGDVMMITDRTNTDYFQVIGVSDDTDITVPVSGVNGFDAIKNNYVANSTKVQLLRETDPESSPYIYYDSFDSIVRSGIKSMVNQIDYSS